MFCNLFSSKESLHIIGYCHDTIKYFVRSASESSMDTSESSKGATPGPAPAAAATPPSSAPAGDVKEADVANMMAMGFPRDACIQELRNNNGDVNLAIAAIFAKSLSASFQKK